MAVISINRWVARKTRTEAVVQLLVGVLYVIGGVVGLILVGTLSALVLYLALNKLREFGHSMFGWQGEIRIVRGYLWMLSSLLIGAMLYVGIRMRNADPTLTFGLFIDVFRAGPRFLLEGIATFRRAITLFRLDVEVCADVITFLLEQSRRVTVEELGENISGFDPVKTVAEMELIDGVIMLHSASRGMSLTLELRKELGGWRPPRTDRDKRRRERNTYSSTRVILDCPKCGCTLRIRAFLVGLPHVCPKCKTRYRTFRDMNGNVRIEKEAARRPETSAAPGAMDYYSILGISSSASDVEIKRAYRKLMKENHPDLFAMDTPQRRKQAEEFTKSINLAYEALFASKR